MAGCDDPGAGTCGNDVRVGHLEPVISIITVCRNSASTIRQTIESVLGQSYSQIEYIIIDGASSDTTVSIIEEYAARLAYWVSEPDRGIYDALNKGILHATGEYVGLLHADDLLFSSTTIAEFAEFLLHHREVDVCYADLVYFKDEPARIIRTYSSKHFRYWQMRFGFMVPHPTFYARRDLFTRLGLYKIDYRVAADFQLMARFFLSGITVARFPGTMVRMRYGGRSTTGLGWIIHQNMEIVRACRENGIATSIILVAMKLPFKLISFFNR